VIVKLSKLSVIIKEHQLFHSSYLKPLNFIMRTPLHVAIFSRLRECKSVQATKWNLAYYTLTTW
jgi:hypothetical protein